MRTIVYFLFLFLGILINSQKAGKIIYANMNSKEENGILYYDNEQSLFITKNKESETSVRKISDGSIVYPVNTIDSIANKTKFVLFDNQEKSFFNNIINNDVETILKDKAQVSWAFIDENKNILSFACKKAVGEYNGKKYIAWYTKQISNSYGPLKINGLDGLILEVFSEDNSLHWIAEKIINQGNENEICKFISKYDFNQAVSREEYKKILDSQLKEFEDKINVNLPERNRIRLKKDCSDCNKK